MCFPTLTASYMYLLWILIGSLHCLNTSIVIGQSTGNIITLVLVSELSLKKLLYMYLL